jgi:3-dehydrocarnitine:acetyl-CoA trimethylamine transferase
MDKRILTCAVTGSSPVAEGNTSVPVTPKQIADQSIEAAKAGATAVHIHVRDPVSGRASMELAHYREVVDRIRDSGVDVLINLTTGPGASYYPGKDNPGVAGPGSNMRTAVERVAHVVELKPDICSLDFATMWFRSRAFINAPPIIAEMAGMIRAAGVLPELEVFDSGDVQIVREMLDNGTLGQPAYFQIVLGTKYGMTATTEAMMYMRSLLPPGAMWAAFGISRYAFPMLAQAFLLGGHARVGLEDTLYTDKGVFAANNADLVRKAVSILNALGGAPASPKEARAMLKLAPGAVREPAPALRMQA